MQTPGNAYMPLPALAFPGCLCCVVIPAEGVAAHATDFAVEYEHRSTGDSLKRADVIDVLANAVPQPPYKVNLSNPHRTILVQVVRNAAGVSVPTAFRQLCKYNLRRLTEEEEEQQQDGGQGTAAVAEKQKADEPAAKAEEQPPATEGEAAVVKAVAAVNSGPEEQLAAAAAGDEVQQQGGTS